MVHLTSVPSDAAAKRGSVVEGMENLKFDEPTEDEVTASVYGSRFAAQELPEHEMPESEMPREVAYRLIRDDLTLDGNPMLNLASFVTTYMVRDPQLVWQRSETQRTIGGRGRKVDGRSSSQELHRLRRIPPDSRDPESMCLDDRSHVPRPNTLERGKCHGYLDRW